MPEKENRYYAAIDIGTVTCRLLIVRVDSHGDLHEQERAVAITNLGEGVDASGVLKKEAMQRVRQEILHFKDIISSYEARGREVHVTAMATSASRDAKNSADFVDMLKDIGIELSVIPGEKEAFLSFVGASIDYPNEQLLVVDIGGGSTELVVGVSGKKDRDKAIEMQHSFDVGCRRVTEKFLHEDPPSSYELERARQWIELALKPYFDELSEKALDLDRIIAVAGTATSIVSIEKKMTEYDSRLVHGSVVDRTSFDRIACSLKEKTLDERKEVVGLHPGRSSVIVAGMIILETILDLTGKTSFTVSETDILHGIILDTIKK